MDIIKNCVCCNKRKVIKADLDGYLKWKNGMNIQAALPRLSANDREMLISGICPECWDNMFGDEEYEMQYVQRFC